MATARETIKKWFSNFKKPTQEHFWAWLDSFWHKNDKIPMQQVEGLETALQSVPTSDQFSNHINDGNAHQALFDKKVDKEDGKGLSSNDYSDEEKQKVHDTADKVIVSGSVTGDVNKILTLTYSDSTTLKIPFKDLGIENVADIMLNSLNFNHETGVLTGLRSDGQQLTVNLDGRYALVGHTHSYNDLEDKPTLLPEAPNDGKQYVRERDTWAVVNNPFDFKGSTELGNVNLNTITQPGVYRQDRGAYANKANNYPTDNIRGGSLYVLPVSSPDASNIFHQLFISGGTTNTGTNTAYYYEVPRIFLRKYVRTGKWVGWFELSSTKRILSQSANTFTTDDLIEELSQHEATILLPDSEVTITINKGKRTHITYVQTSEKSVTLASQDDLTIVGKTSFEGKIGREIKIILAENTAYVSGGDTELPKAPDDDKEYILHNKKWKAFTGWQFKELGTENLNNIKAPGFYGKYNSSEATVSRNYPYDAIRGGHLLVLPMTLGSNLTVFQVYFSAGTQNSGDYTNNARIFMRAFVNNSQWLPWIEFNGGKVHEFIGATQNLASAFNNAFPNNESTFVLKQAMTVTINRSRQIIRYVKDTDADITFTGASGVNVVGGGVVNAPKGTLITVVCYDNNAYVCYDRDSKEDSYVISVTSNLVLDKSHVGRTLQFNNNSNITIDISNFPTGAMLSGVKNSGNGTVTFTGATAPSVDNVIGNTTNSSFALIKNDSGVSNLIISNR